VDDEFASSDDLVARANSFMQRQRPAAPPPIPVLTETVVPGIDETDDLPVLDEVVVTTTETAPPVVAPQQTAPVPSTTPAAPPLAAAKSDEEDEQLLEDFARFISRRFLAELPALIHTALQTSLSGHPGELKSDVYAIAKTARQDFLAEMKASHRR
jgi:hypothetical protein